ncbi:hypothetical protein [Cyanobium sp. LEGE 06113]|uniref:hypothetical protein n=1 Tax=Cyanobium sp. LEGE 06113 TaxID=1297573 RepID=UPI001880AB20|nr:hypothetical protein [Cyanobium sp. LEGE 06113]MBE9152718.1 hypothetical protein [Cyanobium sp. LEGE 06113]MBE9153077.1 hypothetical protein [Cyanobium sp. LEGE 06113]
MAVRLRWFWTGAAALALCTSLAPAAPAQPLQNGNRAGSEPRRPVTTNYLKDPKHHYSFSQWCLNQVPGITEEEQYTVLTIIDSIIDEGFSGSCQDMEVFLMNKQHKLVLTQTDVFDVSPLLSIRGAKNLMGVYMENLGVPQSEVDKMDVLETLPRLKRFTLPNSAGARSKCPLSNPRICV